MVLLIVYYFKEMDISNVLDGDNMINESLDFDIVET